VPGARGEAAASRRYGSLPSLIISCAMPLHGQPMKSPGPI